MKQITLSLCILQIIFSISVSAQSKKDNIIIIQKFYYDTLETNYRKVEFEIDSKAERAKRKDYYTSDTTQVEETNEYIYEDGRFISLKYNIRNEEGDTKKYKIGDTLFEKKINYISNDTTVTITKKIYTDNGISYAARLFPKRQLLPYNEINYKYDKKGKLTKIQENYNSESIETYRTIFDYQEGIVSRMTEYKKLKDTWEKQKIWDYILLTNSSLKNRVKKRINSLLLDNQFKELPW